ncbi:MAG: hypothetical protein ACYTFG_09385, partial [Planctomycetota bacterium]
VSDELRQLVQKLGAKDETFWKPAQEKLEGMGEAAIPGLNWGFKMLLQNLRARSCNILSRMNKSEKMVPGAITALKKYPDDTSVHEARIRQWAARLVADLRSVYTEGPMRNLIESEKDVATKALLAGGLARMGHKQYVSMLIKGIAAEDPIPAQAVAEDLAKVLPHSGFEAAGFGDKTLDERKAKMEEILSWWKERYEKTKPVKVDKSYDPWPVSVEVKTWEAKELDIDPEDLHEVDLNLRDAENDMASGNVRAACGRYFMAFKFSGYQRMDLALKWQGCKRQLGPDNADKSYKEFHSLLIPIDPLNEDFWVGAAKSALASGGKTGKDWARQDLKMALILVPDHEEAKQLLSEVGE